MTEITVAGVTFANPDGQNRQDILNGLGFGYKYATLVQTTFQNERAVEVWIDSQLVGYIPRKHLSDPISYSETLFAQILFSQEIGNYFVVLSPLEPPSIEEQIATCEYCNLHHKSFPTIFDRRAYQAVRYT